MSTSEKVLSANHLGKSVLSSDGVLTILHDICFDLEAGESVAITGSSGSGKSTLLGLLAGLDLPSQGSITLMGQDLNSLDEDGRAKLRGLQVGFVFQSFQLLPHLTALENVMLPAELAGMDNAKAAAMAWLERVGLGERFEHFPKTLSGGEQQRVALARAFITQPAILFADEPTGNLDPQTSIEVMEVLRNINANGKTILMATHDYALVLKYPSKTLKFEEGKMFEVVQRTM
jgi:putative ABC transport system ATP-binding protein